MKKIIGLTSLVLLLAVSSGLWAQEKGPDKDIYYTKPVKSVIFSHKVHVEKGLSCTICHPGTFEMQALKAQESSDFNMKGLAAGKYCGVCHNGTMAFSSQSRCASCHTGVKAVAAPKSKEAKKSGH